MVSIFNFESDFRDYLKKIMQERNVSYRAFAQKAGLDVRVIHDIINKSKHLSNANALKLSKALKHTKNEREYFIQLIQVTQAKNDEEQDFFHDLLLKIRSETGDSQSVIVDKYEYFTTVRHSAIRSLIVLFPFKDDYQRLGDMLSPPVSAEEAKQSVRLLERLGMVKQDANGNYQLNEINISADISDEAKRRFHRECTELVKRQIFYCYPDDCQVLNATVGMSRTTYEIVCDEIGKLCDKVLKLIKTEKEADRVYQIQLALVPLSGKVDTEK